MNVLDKAKNKVSANAQILKGKALKAKGEYQKEMGDVVKGGISTAKGQYHETMGELKEKWENTKDNSGKRFNEYSDDDDVL